MALYAHCCLRYRMVARARQVCSYSSQIWKVNVGTEGRHSDMSNIRPLGQCTDRALVSRMLRLGWRSRAACIGVVALHIALVVLNLGGLGLTGIGIDFIRYEVSP